MTVQVNFAGATLAANSFTGDQTISSASLTPLNLVSTDAGASAGPVVDIFRSSASPAASDALGSLAFTGNSSNGTKRTFGAFNNVLTTATDGAEYGRFDFLLIANGAQRNMMNIQGSSGGVVIGKAPNGGSQSLAFVNGDASGTQRHAFVFDGSNNMRWLANGAATVSHVWYLNGDVGIGTGAVQATTATGGFLLVNGGAGAPTGVPANAATGKNVLYVDETNKQLYLYIGGAWLQPKTPAGAATVTWQ